MKSKVIILDCSDAVKLSNYEQFFDIPIVSAFSISTALVSVNGIATYVDDDAVRLDDGKLVWNCMKCGYALDPSDRAMLEIRYDGIRDYSLLFPEILASDPNRAARLGQFYSEAETCFDGGAWLSFMLMSGAIFEHLLYAKVAYPSDTLASLTKQARSQGLIDSREENTINMTREFRNAIHCNRIASPYVQRRDAMDAKILIERLILSI